MKISKIGYVFIILGIAIILGYLGFSIWSFSNKDNGIVCNKLDIYLVDKDEIKLISQTEIAKILDNNDLNPVGKAYKRIETESIERELMKNPMIKNAECYKTPSGAIRLDVLQRSPKFIIAGQESFYVDADRKLLPVSLNYAIYVPVVTGRVTKSLATGPIYDFVSYLEENPFWNAQIEQIYICEDLNIELIPRVGDAVIMLGKLENYKVKLENLRKLYKQGFNVMGWNRYERIDLQYENQIVCTKVGAEHAKPVVEIVQNNDSSVVKKL